MRGFSLCILNTKIERNIRRHENCKSEILPYPKEHGQGVKILKMMTKNLAKSHKKWGEGVKIGVGGNEAFEPVRSGEPQKSLRGVERKNRVAKNCISIRETILASDHIHYTKKWETPKEFVREE